MKKADQQEETPIEKHNIRDYVGHGKMTVFNKVHFPLIFLT